jgi:hypothetical protein
MDHKPISLSLGIIAFFGLAVAMAQAQSAPYSSCVNSYTNGVSAPAGYGAAWDTVFGILDVSVNCNANTVTVGGGNQTQYVYRTGYVYAGGSWQPLNLTSSSQLQANNWYTGSATTPLGSVDLSQTTYIVGYVCDWSGSACKCGCADNACVTPAWQLQAVQGTRAVATTGTVQGATQICYSWTGTCGTFQGTLALANGNLSQNIIANGSYQANLAPGTYSISVNMGGSCINYSVSPSSITILAGQTVTQDLTITETPCPGSPSQGGA